MNSRVNSGDDYAASIVAGIFSSIARRADSLESIVNAHCRHCRVLLSGNTTSSMSPWHFGQAFK